jgi:hypothetical protein
LPNAPSHGISFHTAWVISDRADRPGRGAENAIVWLGRFGVRHMAHGVVVAHGTRLLTAALYADEYLVIQIKGTIG